MDVEVFNIIFKLRYESYNQRTGLCPVCNKFNSTKRVLDGGYFEIFVCYHPLCSGRYFAIVKKFLHNEYKYIDKCPDCGIKLERIFHLIRHLYCEENGHKDFYEVKLYFKCDKCDSEHYTYNLSKGHWEGNIPIFETDESKFRLPLKKIKEIKKQKKIAIAEQFICEHMIMPLLEMEKAHYTRFLRFHGNKVVVMVDVPNLVRTLRECEFDQNISEIILQTHDLLVKFIKKSFRVSELYIIRYFSKPDIDLLRANEILASYCRDSDKEFFHLLEVYKQKRFSDIDNYLIANAVNIISRIRIKGFCIVSSDKDYLPVFTLSSYGDIKSFLIAINVPTLYYECKVPVIKLLDLFPSQDP